MNLNSPQQVKEFIKQKLGNVPKSTDKLSLTRLKNELPEAKEILDYRELSKLLSTYVRVFLANNANSRIYGNFNQTGAQTGRLSSNNPNLQNIPARSERGKELRKCFIPPPGMKMIVADASQIEPRIIAHYTQDPFLVKIFANGEDFHGKITEIAYCKKDYSPDERFVGKTIGLATLYGAQTGRLEMELTKHGINLPYREVDKIRERIKDHFPTLGQWTRRFEHRASLQGYFSTFGGRKIPYTIERNNLNILIQGSCADYIKLCMVNLYKCGFIPVNCIHDELIFYCWPDTSNNFCEIVRDVMKNSFLLNGVPIEVNVKIAKNWDEK